MSQQTDPKERRKSKRKKILDSFSVFVALPKKGGAKLPVHDVSNDGLFFDYDMDGEDVDAFPLENGEDLEVHFYLNQTLFIPLTVRVVRVARKGEIRQIGGEIQSRDDDHHRAYVSFNELINYLGAEEG